jgi:hypothetical protein
MAAAMRCRGGKPPKAEASRLAGLAATAAKRRPEPWTLARPGTATRSPAFAAAVAAACSASSLRKPETKRAMDMGLACCITFAVSGPASGAGAGPLDQQVSPGVNHCGGLIDSAQTQAEVAGFDGYRDPTVALTRYWALPSDNSPQRSSQSRVFTWTKAYEMPNTTATAAARSHAMRLRSRATTRDMLAG